MEIGFWKLLCKDGPHALPLKQRIPEVAVFRGGVLEACYFSNQRGFFLRRTGQDATREAVLEHLLEGARSRAEASGGSDDAVAILRRPTGHRSTASQDAPPLASVLTTSQLVEIMESADGYANFGIGDTEQWTLQSLVLPADDLRSVAVYSRDALGQERIDVVGRSFQAMYALADASPWPSADKAGLAKLAAVPETQLVAIEAKALAIVQYVQHFQQQSIEGLIAEFVVDQSARVVLHGFWKVSFFDVDVRPIPPDSMRAESFVSSAASKAFRGVSSPDYSLNSSTTMGASVTDAMMASCSTDTGWADSRPTSATLTEYRPTSASRPSSAKAQAYGSISRGESPPEQDGSMTRRPQSPSGTLSHRRSLAMSEGQDLQIPEDDGGGDDDLDETIERLQAARRPASRQRPVRAQRPQPKASGHASRLLLELWDGDRFLGETELQPPVGDLQPGEVASTLELQSQTRPVLRADVRKENTSTTAPCSVRVIMNWQLDSPDSINLRLLVSTASAPSDTSAASKRLRVHLWMCTSLDSGAFACRPVWSSCDATADIVEGVIVYRWDADAVEVAVPKTRPPTRVPNPRRPCSATARIGSGPPAAPVRARPASARGKIGCESSLLQDSLRSSRPSSASTKKPSRPSPARPARPGGKATSGRRSASVVQADRASSHFAAHTADGDKSQLKKTFVSNQVLSRYQMERDARTRLISVLARQLERYRDLLPAWIEQRNAVACVVARMDEELSKRSEKISHLSMEQKKVEMFYTQKYDDLVRALANEQERALANSRAKKNELERSLEAERQTVEVMRQQEAKNADDRASLTNTLQQLNSMQAQISGSHAEMQQAERQAQAQEMMQQAKLQDMTRKAKMQGMTNETTVHGSLDAVAMQGLAKDVGRGAIAQASAQPGFFVATEGLSQLEIFIREKDHTATEKRTTQLQVMKAQEELSRQRANSALLEEFVKKLALGTDGGYLLDRDTKREAAALLAAAAKLRDGRPKSPPRRQYPDPFFGRKCDACDYYDAKWAGAQPAPAPRLQ